MNTAEEGITDTGGSWRKVEGGYVGSDEGLRFRAPSEKDIHRISRRICIAANAIRFRVSCADRLPQRAIDQQMLGSGGFKNLIMQQTGLIEVDGYLQEGGADIPATK